MSAIIAFSPDDLRQYTEKQIEYRQLPEIKWSTYHIDYLPHNSLVILTGYRAAAAFGLSNTPLFYWKTVCLGRWHRTDVTYIRIPESKYIFAALEPEMKTTFDNIEHCSKHTWYDKSKNREGCPKCQNEFEQLVKAV